MDDQTFDRLISAAMDELPQQYITGLQNVVITYADDPTPEQKEKMRISHGQLLLGLYEGIPLTQRGNGYSFVLPDKITLFKNPILRMSHDRASLSEQIKRTLWHEIAHYYGLNHARMEHLQEAQNHNIKSL